MMTPIERLATFPQGESREHEHFVEFMRGNLGGRDLTEEELTGLALAVIFLTTTFSMAAEALGEEKALEMVVTGLCEEMVQMCKEHLDE